MDIVRNTKYQLIYLTKMIRYGFMFASVYLAEKILEDWYVRRVFVDNLDPPNLLSFIGIVIGLDASFNLMLVFIIYLLSLLLNQQAATGAAATAATGTATGTSTGAASTAATGTSTGAASTVATGTSTGAAATAATATSIGAASSDSFLDAEFIGLYITDWVFTTMVLFLFTWIVSSVMQKKKYFRYKLEGMRGIRALKEIVLGMMAILIFFPFFLAFAAVSPSSDEFANSAATPSSRGGGRIRRMTKNGTP